MMRSLPDNSYQSTTTFSSYDLHPREPHVSFAISFSVDSAKSAKRGYILQSNQPKSLCKSCKDSTRNDSDYYLNEEKQKGRRMRTIISIDLCQHQSTSRFHIKSRLNHVSTG
ncbi:unnamed protein product [Lasius platythorax]|uniref:Uncharacterized protein n=1 Tax=Lasius platythorax TaxID=488582 RepID=A0AAV2NEZ0_9HYME